MLAETPVTQCSPCYSAVSASLLHPLPNCSNYSQLCHTHYLNLQVNTSLLQRFTALSSRELMSLEECCSALRKLNNKQRQVVMFLLLFKLSSHLPCPFLFFSILSLLPFSISLFSLSSFLLASLTIPSFSSDQFSVLLR